MVQSSNETEEIYPSGKSQSRLLAVFSSTYSVRNLFLTNFYHKIEDRGFSSC